MNSCEQFDLKHHAKLEADYQTCFARWLKLQTTIDRWELSQNHLHLDESRKARLQHLKTKVEEAQKQLDAAHARRTVYGNSSLAPLLISVEQQEGKTHELQQLASELDQKLAEAAALKKEVENKSSVPSVPPIASRDVDFETLPGSSKRRRTTNGYEDTAAASAAQAKEEIIGLHATLQEVSERVSTIENNIAAQEIEVQEVMQAYRGQGEAGESSIVNPLEARVNHIQDQMDDIATNLSELSEWIAEIYQNNDSITERHEDIIAKKEEEEALLSNQLLLRIEEHEQNRAKDKSEIEALSAALMAYCEKPVSPPSSPFNPETMVSDMEEQIRELVRNAIKPHIEETRTGLSQDLQKHDSEIYGSLWSKLSMTNKIIAAVSQATSRPPM